MGIGELASKREARERDDGNEREFLNNFKCLLRDIAASENDNPLMVETTKVILFFARNKDNDR